MLAATDSAHLYQRRALLSDDQIRPPSFDVDLHPAPRQVAVLTIARSRMPAASSAASLQCREDRRHASSLGYSGESYREVSPSPLSACHRRPGDVSGRFISRGTLTSSVCSVERSPVYGCTSHGVDRAGRHQPLYSNAGRAQFLQSYPCLSSGLDSGTFSMESAICTVRPGDGSANAVVLPVGRRGDLREGRALLPAQQFHDAAGKVKGMLVFYQSCIDLTFSRM